jgi:hypothetical protein
MVCVKKKRKPTRCCSWLASARQYRAAQSGSDARHPPSLYQVRSRFLTTKLRLTVNEATSAVARPEEQKFLGFSISNDGAERRIAPKALDTLKTQVREQTCRTRGLSLTQIVEELTPYFIGWRGYFGFCQTPRMLTNLEAWTRRRLRSYLWRQWGNGHNRFNELRRRGVSQFRAAVAAGSPTGFWRMSGHPAVQAALRNHYFDSLGLTRPHVPVPAQFGRTAVVRDPYARWCGTDGAARRPPIPINLRWARSSCLRRGYSTSIFHPETSLLRDPRGRELTCKLAV